MCLSNRVFIRVPVIRIFLILIIIIVLIIADQGSSRPGDSVPFVELLVNERRDLNLIICANQSRLIDLFYARLWVFATLI